MPGFIQIMEVQTSKIDELDALARRMAEERGDSLLAAKSTITKDRDRKNQYYIIVEFASYEEAMKNSNDPATSKFAEQMAALLDAPPVFRNLDVVSVMDLT